MKTFDKDGKIKLVALIDDSGDIKFKEGVAIEGFGIRDESGTEYNAGLDENFNVIGCSIDENDCIMIGMDCENHLQSCDNDGFCNECGHQELSSSQYKVIPNIKMNDRFVLVVIYKYYTDENSSITAIFDNWQAFKDSGIGTESNPLSFTTLKFIPLNKEV